QMHFLAGEQGAVLAAAAKAATLLWTSASFFEVAEYHFYSALAQAARHNEAPAAERPELMRAIVAHHMQLEAWARNCPENFGNRAALVSAEIARLEGREMESMRLYEQAIGAARANGFTQNEAVANEVAARFYESRGFETIARTYQQNAYSCYQQWG